MSIAILRTLCVKSGMNKHAIMGILCLSFSLSLRARILSLWERRDRCSIGEVRASPCSLLIICCSVSKSCPAVCDNMDCSTPSFPVLHCILSCSNSCPSSRWCHPAISSSVIPFSSCSQSFPALGSFPMSQLFTSGSQIIGVSASKSVLWKNTQDWSPLGWTGWRNQMWLRRSA